MVTFASGLRGHRSGDGHMLGLRRPCVGWWSGLALTSSDRCPAPPFGYRLCLKQEPQVPAVRGCVVCAPWTALAVQTLGTLNFGSLGSSPRHSCNGGGTPGVGMASPPPHLSRSAGPQPTDIARGSAPRGFLNVPKGGRPCSLTDSTNGPCGVRTPAPTQMSARRLNRRSESRRSPVGTWDLAPSSRPPSTCARSVAPCVSRDRTATAHSTQPERAPTRHLPPSAPSPRPAAMTRAERDTGRAT